MRLSTLSHPSVVLVSRSVPPPHSEVYLLPSRSIRPSTLIVHIVLGCGAIAGVGCLKVDGCAMGMLPMRLRLWVPLLVAPVQLLWSFSWVLGVVMTQVSWKPLSGFDRGVRFRSVPSKGQAGWCVMFIAWLVLCEVLCWWVLLFRACLQGVL